MRRRLAALVAFVPALAFAQPQVLVRVDDIGMSHAVNQALEQAAALKVPLSASVMFGCPWYQEAVEILRQNPQISVGVHLMLNSEWKGYRWGPVLGKEAVPSLVDSLGYFLPSSREFLASKYELGEVERELNAQVERAMRSGLKIDYVDHHMGTAVLTPQLRAIVERVASKHGLGISRYFGENYHTMFDTPAEQKTSALMAHLGKLSPNAVNLVVVHMAQATPESMALIDMNNAAQNTASGAPLVGTARAAELAMLLSPEFARARSGKQVVLTNYRELIAAKGRDAMKRPMQ